MIDDELQSMYPVFPAKKDGVYTMWRVAISNAGEVFHTVQGKYYSSTYNFCKAIGLSDEDTLLWTLKFGETLPRRKMESHGN